MCVRERRWREIDERKKRSIEFTIMRVERWRETDERNRGDLRYS